MRLLLTLAACLSLAAPSYGRAAASLTRGPFLQRTRHDATVVVARTSVAATVTVIADLPGGGTVSGSSDGTTRHVVPLAGLPAKSRIPYRVLVDGAAAADGVVHTPGAPGTAAGRRAVLGVIGDYGTDGPIQHGNTARLEAREVEALLTVGDNAYPNGAEADWDPKVFRPMASLLARTTFWPTPGDHEYLEPYAQPYLDTFELPEGPQGERYYSFDWGDLHVVALDTNCIVPLDARTQGCDAETMLAWLRDDLARSRAPWKIAAFHRPAVATGKYGVYPEVPRALSPLFEQYGVDVVFQGHNHLYERTWPVRGGAVVQKGYDHPGAPVYVTAGGGGDWLYDFAVPAAEWTAYREKTGQHVVLTLSDDTLRVESVRPDGSVHDQFTIVKDVPPLPADGEPGAGGGDGGGDGGDGGSAGGDPAAGPIPQPGAGCGSSGSASGLLAGVALALLGGARRRSTRRS